MIGFWLNGAFSESIATRSSSELLTINGVEIPEEEFRMFLQDEKATTANEFSQAYAAEYDEYFWDSEFDRNNPTKVAKENALSKLVQVKIEQQLAVQYGVIRSASFDYINTQMNKEESKYGAESLEELQKYMLYHSKLFIETKNKYKLKAVSVPEPELRHYYEVNKKDRFTLPDQVGALVISLVEQQSEHTGEVIRKLIHEMNEGIRIDELKKQYFSQYGYIIKEKRYGISEGKDENSSELEAQLKEIAYELGIGEMSAPIHISGTTYVVVCIDRSEEKVSTFDEAKQWIQDVLLDERFMQQIEKENANQTIAVNEEWFNQLKIN